MMGWFFTLSAGLSLVFALITGRGEALGAAVSQGAQSGITLAISLAGSLCLWSGVAKLMEKCGFTALLSRLFRPILTRIFPKSRENTELEHALCINTCANFLGLGNAATPMGIRAAQILARDCPDGQASDELCRLVVLNSASIQCIPATVAALRISLGCTTPYDILPAVWLTSLCSAGIGLLACRVFQKC